MVKKASLLVLMFIFACASSVCGQEKKPAATVPFEPWLLHQRLTHEVPPEYPAAALANHIEGDVFVNVVVDENGKIQEAVPVNCPACSTVLGDAAVAAVRKWEYQPILKDGKPVPVRSFIAFRFRLETKPSIEVLTRSESSTPGRLGPPHRIDDGQPIIGGIIAAPGEPPPIRVPQKITIPVNVAEGHLVRKVNPEYPQMARIAHIQGEVVLECVISKSGDVTSLRIVSGPPILAQSALDAVKQWKYSPFLVNGNPVKVETTITVIFHL
jgi:TonB family protein